MAYTKIIFQNSPSTATPINAQNLNHMDDQIALNDQRLTELEGAHVSSFNGRTGAVTPADGDYDIGQIAPLTGAQVGQVPVVTNIGTEEAPELVFRMGAGGGAGGHEIIDSEGNTLPQESAMQFPDSHVSDDSTNGRTVVENVKEVTLAELSQATERGMYLATDEESVPIGDIEEDGVSVTADGVKTYATLLNELYALIDATKLTNNSYIPIFDGYFRLSDATGGNFSFVREFSGAKLFSDTLYLSSASSKIRSWETTTSGSTYSESASSEKPSNGTVITLYYGTSSTVINLKTSANYCQYDENTTVKQKIDEINDDIIVVRDIVNLGNLSANAHGYASKQFNIPTGYSAIATDCAPSRTAVTNGNLIVNASVSGDTVYVTYYSFVAFTSENTNISCGVICKKS